MGGFMLKVKTKQGHHVVSNLSANETICNLKSKISELTKIPADVLNVKFGFPPKPLDLMAKSVSDAGIINGDTLIVEEKSTPDVVPEKHPNNIQLSDNPLPTESIRNDEENAFGLSPQGILLKQVVPSDNSCLFTSIGKFY